MFMQLYLTYFRQIHAKKREKMNKTESIKDLRRLWNAPSVLKPLYYDGALSFIITDANEVIGYNK